MKKTIAWIGATMLTAALFAALMWPEKEQAPKPAAEPNLFAFIRPVNDAEESGSVKPESQIRQSKLSVKTAEEQAASYAVQQPALRDVLDATMKVAAVQQAAQKMRRGGGSEDEVYRMRAAELSAEAAAQLAEMDRNENAWKARVNAYLVEREKLFGSNGNALGMDRQDALQQLRNERFTSDEQKLLSTYEPVNAPQLKMD